MIEINLLPHREAKRAADLRETIAILLLGLVLVGGAIWWVDKNAQEDIASAQAAVRQLKANIEQFKPQEKQVAAFKKKKQQLQVKLDVIHGLDRARSGPLRLMDELSKSAPERLWLTSLKTEGARVTLEGESLDTGVVADFLRTLNASRYFTNVDLDSTSRGKAVQGVKVVKFTVTAEMTNPVDEEASDEEAA